MLIVSSFINLFELKRDSAFDAGYHNPQTCRHGGAWVYALGHEATPRGAMEMPVRLGAEGTMTKARCRLHRVRCSTDRWREGVDPGVATLRCSSP